MLKGDGDGGLVRRLMGACNGRRDTGRRALRAILVLILVA